MRRIIVSSLVATIALLGISIVLPVQTQPQPAAAQQQSINCPAGSYNIGTNDDPICKQEPTGCPYGDSIPMDMCDKFAHQPVATPTEQPKPAPVAPAQCGGK